MPIGTTEDLRVLRTFYFDTGVTPHGHTPPIKLSPGQVWRNGTVQHPFSCYGVPENAVFQFGCNRRPPYAQHLLKRRCRNSTLCSKYAFFFVPGRTGRR